MKRFNKTKTIEDGYFPIFANGTYTMVNGEHSINNMKNLHGFCVCNNLPSGRFAKLQGGYYILTDELKWELIGRTLHNISFKQLYNKLTQTP